LFFSFLRRATGAFLKNASEFFRFIAVLPDKKCSLSNASGISPWLLTIILVFVFGGLSFTKTVISTIVSSSLKQKEAGAGMSLLNFTSFLSEGIGIAIVGGLLSVRLLNQKLLPMDLDQSTYLYSNMLFLFTGVVVTSWLITLNVYKRRQIQFKS